MSMDKIISFPHMGNYHIPIECLLKFIFTGCKVQAAPPITKKTLELGSKYSPDFVCAPFKYNLGNFIEALDNGANILIQAGGGCRYRYYGEVQEQILKDLGYDFEFIQIFSGNINLFALYQTCRKYGSEISFYQFIYYILLIIRMIRMMDKIEFMIRENIGFEVVENSFENLHKKFLKELKTVKNFHSLNATHRKYRRQFGQLKINKPENCLKVGLVGELYSLMEPFSSFFIEKELAKNNIVVSRYTTLTYLLFEKRLKDKKLVKEAKKYLKFHIGADGTISVAKSMMLARQGYDGVIHLKPFGCTPEVNAMPMLQNITKDYRMPILYFSFDSQTSETGIKTRLEAFYDMIIMRKEKGWR